MSGGHGLYHVNGLCPSDFPHNDPVRPHPERCPDQLADGDLTYSLHIGISRLKSHQVGYALYLQLSVVLDRYDPLPAGNKLRQGIQKGGLSRAGAPADKNIVSGYDQHFQKACCLITDCPHPDQILHGDLLCGEFPYGHHRPVERHRVEDYVDSGAIRQPGIRNGHRLVDHAVGSSHDLLDHILQPAPGGEALVRPVNLPLFLHENVLRSVDHDLRDLLVLDQVLEQIQPAECIVQVPAQFRLFLKRNIPSVTLLVQHLKDQFCQFIVSYLS